MNPEEQIYANAERRRGAGRGRDERPLLIPDDRPSPAASADDESLAQIRAVIDDAETVILTTVGHGGTLRGRPMIPHTDGDPDEIWFATRAPSSKASEIELDARAMVSYQGDATALVLSGRAEVIRDPAEIRRRWDASWDRWFRGGADSGDVALVRFHADRAELWDASGVSLVELAWEVVRAWVHDRTPPRHIERTTVTL